MKNKNKNQFQDGPHETINGNLVCQFDAAALYIFIALLALYILLVIVRFLCFLLFQKKQYF